MNRLIERVIFAVGMALLCIWLALLWVLRRARPLVTAWRWLARRRRR